MIAEHYTVHVVNQSHTTIEVRGQHVSKTVIDVEAEG